MKGNGLEISEGVLIAKGAVVDGDVKIGAGSNVWYNAVIRGDDHYIEIGENTNVQDNATLHVSLDAPLVIGNGVTIGHGAIMHGCTIGDDSLIGMGAIILDKAVIGKNCLVGAGALVTSGTIVPDGSLVIGSPAKVRRELTPEEIQGNIDNAKLYVEHAKHLLERE